MNFGMMWIWQVVVFRFILNSNEPENDGDSYGDAGDSDDDNDGCADDIDINPFTFDNECP